MFCKNCGGQMPSGTRFCPSCGCPNENNVIQPINNVQQTVQPTNIQQPIINQQPVMNMNQGQPVMQQPNQLNNVPNQPKKKKDMILFIIIAIIGIAIIAIPIILNMNKDKKEDVKDKDDNNNIQNNGTNNNNNSNNNNNNEKPNTNESKDTEYDGFMFKIPDEYKVSTADDGLTIMGDNWFAMLEIETGSYDYFRNEKEYLKNYMISSGFDVGEVKTETYDGVEFLTADISQNDSEMVLAYAKLSNDKIAIVVVANYLYTADESLLNNVAPIIKSATPSTGTQGL